MFTTVCKYESLLSEIRSNRSHLLLGNGFSIGCDPVFQYPSLFQAAVAAGLSARAQLLFQRLGTNNFEGVMRLLEDSHWVNLQYGLGGLQPMLDDLEVIKNALVSAVSTSHLAHTGLVPDQKKMSAATFFEPYHNVFTTNYDLLLYWINVAGKPIVYGDGFRDDDLNAKTVCFREHLRDSKGIFYVHGGLHLFVDRGDVRKHCWRRSGRALTDSVRSGLAQGKYPLFVAEGTAEKKREQIQRNGYLAYCYGKLYRIENRLVVYGFSMGDSDEHIKSVIVQNVGLKQLFVGLYDYPASASSHATISACFKIQQQRDDYLNYLASGGTTPKRKRGSALEIKFFDGATAKVWNQ
jgi:hypothetical protein